MMKELYACSLAAFRRVWNSTTSTASLMLVLFTAALGAQAQQRPAPLFFQQDATARRVAAQSPLAAALRQSEPLTLDVPGLRAALATAPAETRAGAAPLVLTLPLPSGSIARFQVLETALMEPGLAAQFPSIKTYTGVGLDDPTATVRLDLTPHGFHAQVLSAATGDFFIDPATRTDTQHYLSFWKRDMPGQPFSCGVVSNGAVQRTASTGPVVTQRTSGPVLRTFRLAVAATGEYTAFHGGTVALAQAAIVTSVNRVVGVYEKEMDVRMVLVANNSSLVYTNAATDPYTNSSPSSLLTQNQANVDAVIGTANYDIGHVFSTAGGGLAGLGVVCSSTRKAQGETGTNSPIGDAFDIDYVAHEMGHQFGGNHTFNSVTVACGGGTRSAAHAYEPGSGSTIMAYAGICAADDLQPHSDAYFHVESFEEIQAYLATQGCGTTAATGNTAPAVVLPASGKVLPISTPFKLTAIGSDAEGDALTYNWEEYDLGTSAALTTPQAAGQTFPLFRSFNPSVSPTRYFPRLSDLVANTSTTSERLPSVTRPLTFRVTLRDQHNGAAGVVGGLNSSAAVVLSSTSTAGPFVVTAPNTAVTWAGNSAQLVNWDVAGTDANFVNCATVNLRLSTDGGFTYPTLLLANTPNDGTQAITVPNTPTTTARVMVEAADNYFFDISDANFTITAAPAVTVVSINRAAPSPTNAASVPYTAVFSGAVTGLSVSNFALVTTGVAGASVASLTGSGTTYTVTVNTGTGSGTIQLQLNNATGVSPTVSNVPFAGETYTIDKTAPTVSVTSTAANPTSISPIPVTVTFSESVTGFSTAGITVTNGTLSGFGGSGTTYTFSVTPAGNGPVTVDVAANAAQDAATNGNTAAPQFSITYQAVSTNSVWTGATSTDWFTASNWTAGVPTIVQDAIIIPSSFGRQPVIGAGSATSHDLVISANSSLTMSDGTLDVRGDWANNGAFTATGGTVIFGVTVPTNLPGPNLYGTAASRFWNLRVQANGLRLSTTAGASVQRVLALTGNFVTLGNPFTLLSSGAGDALVVNSGGTVVGAATVRRFIDPSTNPGLGYRHYSAPVSNTNVADLATPLGFTPTLNPAYNTSATPTAETPFPTVFGYDEARVLLANNVSGFDKGYFSPTALTDPLVPGRGYTVNIAAIQLVDFVGTLNNGDLTMTLSNNRSTSANAGWHLLGNPYPAPLDVSLVAAADRQNLEGATYVFSSLGQYTGQYRTYNNNIGNPVVASGQGFFVRVQNNANPGALTFRNSQRLTVPSLTTFQRPAETRPLVQLTLQGSGGTALDEAYVYFQAGATAGVEADYDAVKLPNPSGLDLSALAGGQELAINGLPLLGSAPLVVPLRVRVPAAGSYTLRAGQLLNLTGTPVYLHDWQLGTFADLRQQPAYNCTLPAAPTSARFELVFGTPQQVLSTGPAALAAQVALYPNPAHAAVAVQLPAGLGQAPVGAALVDALGRVVLRRTLPAGAGPHLLPLDGLASGVYALRLSTAAGMVVKRLVIN